MKKLYLVLLSVFALLNTVMAQKLSVESGGYISKSGCFTIGKGDMTPIKVSLVSVMAKLSVSCPTPSVSLYVDKKFVGSLPWNGSLGEGMHLLEVRKDGHRSR